jgi:hypothetical protein
MSNETATNTIRRSLTFYYIGRPASLYIEALARRRRTRPNPAASPHAGDEQPHASITGLASNQDLRDSDPPVVDERVA